MHLESYSKLTSEVELIGVHDIIVDRAQAAAHKYGVEKVYLTLDELLADPRIQAVSAAKPNVLHAPLAVAALKAGKHVYVEKPMAIDARGSRTIVDAETAAGKKVLVGVSNRFTEAALFAKKYVDSGALGDIYHGRACRHFAGASARHAMGRGESPSLRRLHHSR